MYGEGGVIGPEITGANRSSLEYLLGNMVTPSAVIQDAYKMHIVLTDDGRVYSGIPAGENERQLRLLPLLLPRCGGGALAVAAEPAIARFMLSSRGKFRRRGGEHTGGFLWHTSVNREGVRAVNALAPRGVPAKSPRGIGLSDADPATAASHWVLRH